MKTKYRTVSACLLGSSEFESNKNLVKISFDTHPLNCYTMLFINISNPEVLRLLTLLLAPK